MRRISFAWTTPALLAGAKTVTRRDWKTSWARQFKAGELVAAFEKAPRAGGKQVATIRLLATPTLEPLSKMSDDDFVAEGFDWLSRHDDKGRPLLESHAQLQLEHYWSFFHDWQARPGSMWVVRFELMAGAE